MAAAEDEQLDELIAKSGVEDKEKTKEEVKELLGDVKKDDMKNLRSVLMVTGWPVVKDTLFTIIEKNVKSETKKKAFKNKVLNLEETKEEAGINFIYKDIRTGEEKTRMFSFQLTDTSYNYEESVGFLEEECGREKFVELLQLTSNLIHVVNMLYASTIRNNMQLLKDIAPETYRHYGGINIDQSNNSLYIVKEWDVRFGLMEVEHL